jgi:phage terminase large subunit
LSDATSEIIIPNWTPREYQLPLWRALQGGVKRATYTWHRRAGKDDLGLHWTACSAVDRPGTYWYLLPQAAQARKAIWDAVDPHTGKKRIDTAFPKEIRKRSRDNEMFIEFFNGSTWQVVGSDNYDSLVGSPPVGVVLSEYALSNPSAWSYLRPILMENGGWALFNFTPRGRNHAVKMFEGAKDDPDWFVQKLTAEQTGLFTKEQLEKERMEYVRELGEDDGEAKYRQEYFCDFDAPLVGAYYAKIIAALDAQERIVTVDYDKLIPVHTAWDLGYTDDTAIWFYQTVRGEIRVIDYYYASGQDIPHYLKMLQTKPYVYGKHHVPWDAVPKTLASGGKSILEQLSATLGTASVDVVPNLDLEDGIQAVRAILPRCWFDAKRCKDGLEALRNYQRQWDDERKVFKQKPEHTWASHASDAFRYLAVSYTEHNQAIKLPVFRNPTMNEAWASNRQFVDDRI